MKILEGQEFEGLAVVFCLSDVRVQREYYIMSYYIRIFVHSQEAYSIEYSFVKIRVRFITAGKLSISPVRMCNFTRIECKTKKLRHSIIPGQTLSDQPGLEQHPKGVNYHFSSPQLDKPYIVG